MKFNDHLGLRAHGRFGCAFLFLVAALLSVLASPPAARARNASDTARALTNVTAPAATRPTSAAANATYVTYTQSQIAAFGQVDGESIDAGGDVYIVASYPGSAAQIWKETPGNGTYTQSTITSAATGAQGIAVDAQGNLFISDSVTNSIFKETATGSGYTESTVVSGFADPAALAVDASGNLYVVDVRANTLLKETLSGGVYTQSIISSTLNNAAQVAVDSSGNVYVADAGNNRVVKETYANGAYTESVIGSGLSGPDGVAIDAGGIVYIADTGNVRLLAETPVNGSYVQAVAQATLFANLIDLNANDTLYYTTPSAVYTSVPNELAEAAATNFGSAPVGGTVITQSITFTFDAGGALASVPYFVSTQGVAQLDFVASTTQASDACVTGKTFATGATCTVSVAFSPTHPGWRYGAVVVNGPAGTPIGTAYLEGIGTAPQVSFSPGTIRMLTPNLDVVYGVASGSAGDAVFIDNMGTYTLSYANLNNPSFPPTTNINNPDGSVSAIGLDGAGNIFSVDYNGVVTLLTLVQGVSGASNQYEALGSGTHFEGFSGPGVGVSTDAAKIDGSGNVFIGSGNRGDGDFSATSTAFLETFTHGGYAETSLGSGLSNTTGLAVDGDGAVYLLDQGNSRIVKETPAAGSFTQSVLFTALNSSNTDIAVDALGNLYIPNGSTILKQTVTNGSYTASTLALDGLTANGRINTGSGFTANGSIIVDGSGNVLFTQVSGSLDAQNMVLYLLDLGDAPTINFATTAVGATSSDSPFKLSIANSGNSTLTFAAPPTDANPSITAGFTMSSSTTCPLLPGSAMALTLAPGASCDIYVNFVPTVPGAISGTLTVTDNSLNSAGTKQIIQLIGEASGPSTPLPSVTLTPASSNYGTVSVGSSGSATLTLVNTGTVAVAISSASVPGGPFTVASTTCSTSLAIAANCVYLVKFSPNSAGAASATFSVTDDAGTQTAALTGNGAAVATAPNATLTPATLAFGTMPVGSTTAAQTLTLANTGTAALTISSIALGRTNAADFAIASDACGTTLAAGASCAIKITFSPTAVSASNATVTITDNSLNSPQTSTLTGTGTPDDFGVTASPASQSVIAGSSASYAVDVTSLSGIFSDSVTLAVSGLPTGATATFSPSSVAPGTAGATSTMTIQTATLAAGGTTGKLWPFGAPLVAVIFLIPMRTRRAGSWRVSCLMFAVITASLAGCSNGGYALPQTQTQPKVYTVTVTGTSGSLKHSTTVQLTIR